MIMRHLALALLLAVVVTGGTARAGGIDDLSAALAAHRHGDLDEALRLYTQALVDGDLSVKNQAVTRYNRGLVYNAKDLYDAAIVDFDASLTLDPNNPDTLNHRGLSYRYKGQFDKALTDYDEAIRLKPNHPDAYNNRGLARFVLGRFSDAAADLQQNLVHGTPDAFGVLFLHLARARSGANDTDEFNRNAAKIDRAKWPGPALSLFLGQTSPEQLRAAAAQGDATTQKYRLCNAAFLSAEYRLLKPDPQGAAPLFQDTIDTCPIAVIEQPMAATELARISD
jgi:lipoprotein NlpI